MTALGALLRGPRVDLGIDGERLLRRIAELGRIGATPEGGVTRPAFSAQDRHGRRYVRDEAERAGLEVQTDAAGNMLFRRPRAVRTPGPALLLGSHLDTVIDGGRYDGAYGVLAAIEVVQRVAETETRPAVEPVAVAFANEEGARFPQPFWGSLALTGQTARLPAEPLDRDGEPLREPLRLVGGDLNALPDAAWRAGSVHGYLELHIEQGPVLERRDVPIGVVTGIVGRVALDVHVRGAAGHAGTTPMADRRDAAVAAGHVVLATERLAADAGRCRVATAGRLAISPDATNVVPGGAFVSVEFRDERADRLAAAEAEFRAELTRIERRTGCAIDAEETLRSTPAATDSRLRAVIADAATDLGLDTLDVPSGAGHDAQVMSALAPVGMIFVPSRDGLSHVPQEYTEPEQLVAGAEVLLRAALAA